jgi:hypothetical protein
VHYGGRDIEPQLAKVVELGHSDEPPVENGVVAFVSHRAMNRNTMLQ